MANQQQIRYKEKFIGLSMMLFLVEATSLSAQTVFKNPALPSPQQVQWQNMERTIFVHFALITRQGTAFDNQSTPLSRINPSKLDVNQWIDAAESFGAKMIIFVAKHVGGFCLWQTKSANIVSKTRLTKTGKAIFWISLQKPAGLVGPVRLVFESKVKL